jgi:hypothetical protein
MAQVLWFQDRGTLFFFQNMDNGTLQHSVFLNQSPGPSGTLSTPTVLKRTALAAVDWNDGVQLRLYYQAEGGELFEQVFDDGDWSFQGLPSALPSAALGTGLAALSWSNGSEIRLYSQNNSQAVQAYVWSKKSWSSDPNPNVSAIAGSALAAIGWNNGQQQRLYFEDENGGLCESVYSGGWQAPTTLLTLIVRTALAAVSWGGTSSGFAFVRVYYQDENNVVRDICYNGGPNWTAGTLEVTARAGTSLCAVQLNNGTTIRDTDLDTDGGFGEAVWNGTAWAYHSQTG